MSDREPPYWVFISVLFSSYALSPAVAMCLIQAAYDLHRTGGSAAPVAGDILSGQVRNLRKDALVGTIGGPVFEADLETERGRGSARFILTRSGIELLVQREQKPPMMN